MKKKIRLFVGKEKIKEARLLSKFPGVSVDPVQLALAQKFSVNRNEIKINNTNPRGLIVSYYTQADLKRSFRAPWTRHLEKWYRKLQQRKAKGTKFRLTFCEI